MANGGLYGDPNVHTTFTGDATLIQAAAAQATRAVDEAAAKIKARNAEIADDIDEFSNLPKATGTAGQRGDQADPLGFKQSVGAVTSFLGKMTAVVGIAGAFFGIGQKIRELWIGFFETGTAKAERFMETLGADPTANLKKINDELDTLRSRLAANSENTVGAAVNYLTGSSTAQLEEQIKKLEGAARANAQQIRAQEDRKRAEFEKTERERQRLEAESQQKEALDRERADDEREARLREFAEEQQRDGLERQRQLEQAALESAERIAEAMSDAMLKPLQELIRANQQFLEQQRQALEVSLSSFTAGIQATESTEPGWGVD